MNLFVYLGLLIGAFAILFKSADLFVDSAVGVAEILRVPKMIIGIVLVGFATTAPEFAVSVQSAYLGHPEIALGNAIGSVICDDGLAMGLAAIFTASPILIDQSILRRVGFFLVVVYGVAYGFAFNGSFGRLEGMTLVFFLGAYLYYVFITERGKTREASIRIKTATPQELVTDPKGSPKSARRQFIYFIFGLAGVVISSRVVLWSSIRLATYLKIPEVVIGLTIIAVGTSLPEVGTCIVAARKGQGEIAAGNIIGADILNILWIIGVSSMVNPMQVSRKMVQFMFPWMFLIVGVMLLSMRHRHRIGKPKGLILLSLYGLYLLVTIRFFY